MCIRHWENWNLSSYLLSMNKGKARERAKTLNSPMTWCLLEEIPVFWPFDVSPPFYFWIQLSAGRLENIIIAKLRDKPGATNSQPKWQNIGAYATWPLKKRVFGNVIVKKCCRLIFDCLALSRGAEVFGLTHKAFHNASGALCAGKLTNTKQQCFVASQNTQTNSLIITLWTLLKSPAYLKFEKHVERSNKCFTHIKKYNCLIFTHYRIWHKCVISMSATAFIYPGLNGQNIQFRSTTIWYCKFSKDKLIPTHWCDFFFAFKKSVWYSPLHSYLRSEKKTSSCEKTNKPNLPPANVLS